MIDRTSDTDRSSRICRLRDRGLKGKNRIIGILCKKIIKMYTLKF